jgi:hypothetical protein
VFDIIEIKEFIMMKYPKRLNEIMQKETNLGTTIPTFSVLTLPAKILKANSSADLNELPAN